MTSLAFRLLALTIFAASLAACGGAEGADAAVVTDDAAFEEFDSAYEEGKEDSARSGRFEVFVGNDGRYYFHLLAKNGQKVLRSQDYASERSAYDGIAVVRASAPVESRVELRESVDGETYFVVKGSNGAIVGVSELYASASNAQKAIAALRTTVKTATGVSATSAAAKFQVFKGLDSKYYFHARAKNGAILVQSEAYAARSGALNGTASVSANGATASRYEVRDARNGQAYFVLSAANGQVIALSEVYASRAAAGRARDAFIALVKSGIAAPR